MWLQKFEGDARDILEKPQDLLMELSVQIYSVDTQVASLSCRIQVSE